MARRSHILRPAQGWRSGPPGIAMILTLLLVGLLFVMALSLVSLSSSDYQASNNGSLSIQSLYNADAGLEEAKMRVSPATLAPNAAAGVNIPYNPAADWRAYVFSGSMAAPTQAQMKAAICDSVPPLDATCYKKVWDTTQTEGSSNYIFYNTVQASNKIQWGWARIQQKVNSLGQRFYMDVATNVETTAPTTSVGGTPVNNLPILIITSEGIQKRVRRMIQMQINPIKSTSTTTTTTIVDPFGNGAYGKEGVTMSGNNGSTDSYDSALGPYNTGGNKGNEGNVVTDATTAGAITIGNNTVNGDAKIGSGGDITTGITLGPNGDLNGNPLANANVTTPPITIPTSGVTDKGAVSLSGSSGGNPKDSNPCAGATMILTEGTYKMSSLSITGNGSLCVTGKVILYVDGNIDIGGNGILNGSGLPPNLLIYASNNCTDVKVHGNGNFYGAVYAPNAAITITGSPTASMYGAATGKTVEVKGNGAFHYDKALGRVGEWETQTTSTTYTTSGYSRFSWREIPF